jgi:molecular chaperone GrpE
MSTKKTPQDHAEEKIAEAAAQETEETAEKAEPEDKTKKKKDKSEEELIKIKEEIASEKDKYLRLLAEYDNFRKRSQKERESIYTEVRADTVMKFLPVYDNLERALKAETADEAYSKGVEMTMTQFKELLSSLGVTEIIAKAGTVFDPTVHNAVMHVEDANLGESVIAEEFQKGFKLADKVLRCSIVKVAN